MPNINARSCTHVAADGSIIRSENCSVEPERYWEGLHIIGKFRCKSALGEWEDMEATALTLPVTGTVIQWK